MRQGSRNVPLPSLSQNPVLLAAVSNILVAKRMRSKNAEVLTTLESPYVILPVMVRFVLMQVTSQDLASFKDTVPGIAKLEYSM